MVSKSLKKRLKKLEIRGRTESIQTSALLKSSRKVFWWFETTCCPANSSKKKQIVWAGEKTLDNNDNNRMHIITNFLLYRSWVDNQWRILRNHTYCQLKKRENFSRGFCRHNTPDHRMKLKEGEKINKYVDLARELRKLRNMRMIVMPFVCLFICFVLRCINPFRVT